MNVDIPMAMGVRDLFGIDMRKPVISNDLAGDIKDHAAQRITLIGIRIHAPIEFIEVLIDRRSDVDHGLLVPAQFLVLFAIDDIRTGGLEMVGGDQYLLHNVLDLFDVDKAWRVTIINNFYNL